MQQSHSKTGGLKTACAMITLLTLACVVSGAGATDDEKKSARPTGVVSTLWGLQDAGEKVTLLVMHGDPLTLAVQPDTLLAGMCLHCNIVMEVKAGQSAKTCTKCACNTGNAECFVNKVAGKNGWTDLFKALPKGTVLRVETMQADKPDSGLKRLTIDYKTALLPIQSASAPTLDVMLAAAKAVGGTSVELDDEGTRLLIHLKTDWTQDRETRLAKSLAQIGVDVAFPPQEKAAK